MVIRQSEGGLDRLVAAVAEVRFGLLQEAVVEPTGLFGQLRKPEEVSLRGRHRLAEVSDFVNEVRCVALIAGNAMGGVFGFAEKVLHFACGMATEAVRSVLFGAAFELKNRMFDEGLRYFGVVTVCGLDGVRVGFGGAVAGFTTLDIGLVGKRQLGVSRFIEFDQLVFVATAAGI
ncbi:MAG TPA: hypothetical protein VJS43_02975, partial [Candidatus Acidoferrales bacterium]|nr:hypothetical protein [Candidatus Acidoferrales bacterium]